jgi:hypothetical protein
VEVCTDQECCHLIKTFFDAVNKKKSMSEEAEAEAEAGIIHLSLLTIT